MLRKTLVANRGEVALRVIRTCRELGIRTVAVFSEADRASLHVRYADEAYCVGPAPARESYLRGDVILDVARRCRADAIHPGYGFLAENADFCQACVDAGLVWIGPPPDVLRLAANKINARRVMREAGLPVIEGVEWNVPSVDPYRVAEAIGYPLVIRSAGGGGGRGIRIVRTPEELPRALAAARREGEATFGDGTVYLEKALQGVRHIEFQMLADHMGNIIHLGEREASIQRQNQNLLEEAPSRVLDPAMRERMGQVAVAAARAVGFKNAGTVEFLLDEQRQFHLLEINPRLQVEHPTTEMVTGVDIVKEQLRIASGRRLRYTQDDIKLRGWSIECRILAENPYDNFVPSVGTITYIREPSGPGVRMESGVYPGFQVTPNYDPMIAKVITWGETRAEAILRMRRALDEYRIMGVRTNIALHQQILNDMRFLGGQVDTAFLDQTDFPETTAPIDDLRAAAVLAAVLHKSGRPQAAQPSPQASGGSNWKRFRRELALRR